MKNRHFDKSIVIALLTGGAIAGCGGKSKQVGNAEAPAQSPLASDPAPPVSKSHQLASVALQTPIFARPDRESKKLGYLRLGAIVPRSEKSVAGRGCVGPGAAWYAIDHAGYVCTTNAPKAASKSPSHEKARWEHEATLDLAHPLVRALRRLPDLDKPMPYPYAFVRAVAPLYFQVPTAQEQMKAEFKLTQHLTSYKRHTDAYNAVEHGGANAVMLGKDGVALGAPEAAYPAAPTEKDEHTLFGGNLPNVGAGDVPDDGLPWWLHVSHAPKDNLLAPRFDRDIPNVSTFAAPDYAIFGARIARHAGVAIIGTFVSVDAVAKKKDPVKIAETRRFAVTIDGRLLPTDKLKPHVASAFHGISLTGEGAPTMPFAFVRKKDAHVYTASDLGHYWPKAGELAYRSIVPLTGKERRYKKVRYLEAKDGRWLDVDDVAYVDVPAKEDWPKEFDSTSTKWVDVSIWQQTLVAYEGQKPVYVTLISTGIDGMGDPKKTKSTIRGAFRIDAKHVTTTMDADDPESKFELRDVPWVQYFERGYALHATYWHDDFGKPRSHGCINLAPIDAHWLFFWTDPGLPEGWHGVRADVASMSPGTWVRIHG